MKFFQMSYGKPNNELAVYNATPNTPAQAVKFFERIANSCVPGNFNIQELQKADDEYDLMFQLVSFSKHMGFVSIKYGFKDNVGRDTLIANGYIAEAGEGDLDDPSVLTSISMDSFSFVEEDVGAPQGNLKTNPALSVKDAFKISGIDEQKFKDILSCVYSSFNNAQRAYSTYFKFDGSNEQIMAIIHLILSALPRQMRYNIAFANANAFEKESSCKSFVFVKEVPNGGSFYDIATGDTNIRIDLVKNNPESFPFIDIDVNSNNVFDELYNLAQKMNLSFNASYQELLLTKTILDVSFGKKSINVKIEDHVKDLFKYPLPESKFTDAYIVQVLNKYHEKGNVADDDLLYKIDKRCASSKQPEFLDIYKHMRAAALIKEGEQSVYSFLDSKSAESVDDFKEWAMFIKNCGGDKLITNYFISPLAQIDDMDTLLRWFKKYKEIVDNRDAYKFFNDRLREMCVDELLSNLCNSNHYFSIIDHYKATFKGMFNQDVNDARYAVLVEDFWKKYNCNSFEFSKAYIDNISQLINDSENPNEIAQNPSQTAQKLTLLYNKVIVLRDVFSAEEKEEFIALMKELNYEEILSKELNVKVKKLILDYLGSFTNKDLVFWFDLFRISLRPTDYYRAIKDLVDEEMPVLLDKEIMEAEVKAIADIKDLYNLIVAIGGTEKIKGYLDIYDDSKSSEYKALKNCYNLLLKQKKELQKSEKKRQDREEDEQRKALKKNSSSKNESNDDKLPKKIFSLFKRR